MDRARGREFRHGRPLEGRNEPVDWFSAEQRLEEIGLGYLTDRFAFHASLHQRISVHLLEVSPRGIIIQGGLSDNPKGES
ncbi:hypothetical protein [Citricoccus muralis]|uniref:Uncharacterized protein n=1 Tax=Citricoccus muralis TaxID=169134 RepID=A0ABY8H8L7_9MICC|nr:hypothetical protein [Citricoccus muralis]WFP17174.1 hypothetical protein P8192_03335 [Citricoccus muralis]